MARPTTLTGHWLELADAFGGPRALSRAAEISPSNLYHIAHENSFPSPEVRERILTLADIAGVPSPLRPLDKPKLLGPLDERIMMMLGRNLKGGQKVPKDFKDRYSKRLGEELLLTVGTSEDYSEEVHIAASELLGL